VPRIGEFVKNTPNTRGSTSSSRIEILAWLTSWVFCGFFALAAIGFVQHAYWNSAALALLMTLALAPPTRDRFFPAGRSSIGSLLLVGASVAITIGISAIVAERERDQQQADYEQHRDETLAAAERAKAQLDLDAINESISTYRFIETPELDQIAAAARREAEQKRQRIEKIQKIWLDAAEDQQPEE
jgi:hypothetical protein